jgi:hypothetical protein
MIYHHKVTIKLACGCQFDQYIQLAEGVEPDGPNAYASLLSAIMHPQVAEEVCIHDHTDRGQETIDVSVRTKVGPIPDEVTEGT